ncbi:TPA: DUF4406 domain-containing protein, partial [Escherichia coli]
GLTQPHYMDICMAMIRCVDAIYMLKDWQRSAGAKAELALAEKLGHVVVFQRGAICRLSGFRRCGKKKCGKVL